MLPRLRISSRLRAVLLLSAAALILATLPAAPGIAGGATVPLTNSLDQFAGGDFFRTALDSDDYDGASNTDLPGSVKLTRTGSLRPWSRITSTGVPALTDAPMVALGSRVFIIGGRGGEGGSGIFSDKVYWTEIDPDTGAPTNPQPQDPETDPDWISQDLPPAQHSDLLIEASQTGGILPLDCNNNDVRARGNVAAAAYSPGNSNTGVIYVLGGAAQCDYIIESRFVSSYAFQYGTVAGDGSITWQSGPKLPIPELLPDGSTPDESGNFYEGIQDAIAQVIEVEGRRFLYLIGGLRVDQVAIGGVGLVTEAIGSKKTYYIELDANGIPLAGAQWQATADLPLPSAGEVGATNATQVGLWKAAGTGVTFDVGGGGVASASAIFVTGGQQVYGAQTVEGTYNVRMFRGNVAPDGAVTWTTTPGNNNDADVTLPERRYGMLALSNGGKIYAIGGLVPSSIGDATTVPAGTRKSTVLTVPVEDNLSIQVGAGSPYNGVDSNNILANGDLLEPAGAVTVPATPTPSSPNATWVLVFGGRSGASGDPSNALIRGQLGGQNETVESGFTSSGWYYSEPRPITFEGGNIKADVHEIVWTAQIDRAAASNMDIQVQFRVATPTPGLGACLQPGIFSDEVYDPATGIGPPNGWRNLEKRGGDFFTADGAGTQNLSTNVVRLVPRPEASCFQYRALMSTAGNVTPALYNVGLTIVLPGRPDIKIPKDENGVERFAAYYNQPGILSGFELYLVNQNEFEQPTQPADFAEQVIGQGGGSFFVDMCIFGPTETMVPPPNPYEGQVTCADVYTKVDKISLPPDGQVFLSNNYWFTTNDVILNDAEGNPVTYQANTLVNILDYFRAAGTYQVYAVIDSTQPSGLRCEVNNVCVDEGLEGGELNNISEMVTIEVTLRDIDGDGDEEPSVEITPENPPVPPGIPDNEPNEPAYFLPLVYGP